MSQVHIILSFKKNSTASPKMTGPEGKYISASYEEKFFKNAFN